MGVDGAESEAASVGAESDLPSVGAGVGAEGLSAGPAVVGRSTQKWWGEGGAESETPSAGVVAESASETPSAGVVVESASASVVGAEGLLAGPAAVGMSMQKWWGEGGKRKKGNCLL